ncbi:MULTISPECIES: hypothetical protein [unclassified Streptomyces]|uniref:hypothetical protein n=1 Tax=unclassified Streptomyces TaxID=2593676 RepID=UPI002E803AFB|nr:hypothetical protein [Streptomyces sp. NBC_00589]WTI35048.1 hypothetical protein OIC96_08625 [Streptomyces sp. NBC_00775]WUB31278.1 hypothetical protein OHA51_41105 [Streptomyces sp. NBC_00589]
MIGWAQIGYGAVLSAVFAAGLIVVARGRTRAVVMTGALAAAVGPLAWNAVLRAAHGDQFFTDAPVIVFPVSWQDTGSGVFTLAAAALGYGLGPLAAQPTRTSIRYALLAAGAALLVDVYLY